jgi:hypothetical protein
MSAPTFETSRLSYDKLAARIADLQRERVEVERQLQAAAEDAFIRRLDRVRTGKDLPEPGPLRGLANWAAQERREQMAADNRRADEALAAHPDHRGSFALPS